MDFSPQWKSMFPVSASYTPQLLLSESSILGPLIFNPTPEKIKLLFSSPSVLPPIDSPPQLSLSRFLLTSPSDASLLPSTASSVASLYGSQYVNDLSSAFLHNCLEILEHPDGKTLLVFFPSGVNSEKVGFLVLYVKGSDLEVHNDRYGHVFQASSGFSHRILRISVNPVANLDLGTSNLKGSSYSTIGFLLASTLYSVQWFIICINKNSSCPERPGAYYLGCKTFKTCSVVHACWSPHLPEESAVLLENGELFLFDLALLLEAETVNTNLKGTKLRVPWNDLVCSKNIVWLSCEFSWDPRILVVARSDAVFVVDFRLDQCNVSCLMKAEMLGTYASPKNEQFLAFSRAGSDFFYFTVASNSLLFLCDVRRPMMPVLQWAHGLDRPSYIHVLSLSNMRSHSKKDTFKLASKSGFCIILGSFCSCEFNLFCYGSSLTFAKGSIASKFSKTNATFYAWQLPSKISLSGLQCHCGSCLLWEVVSRGVLPEWIDWRLKKEMVSGFGILNSDLAGLLCEPEEFGGFTLVRLMSSGKLELQRYHASWVAAARDLEFCHKKMLCLGSPSLYSMADEKYKFPKRSTFLKLDKLIAYMSGNLTQLIGRKLKQPCMDAQMKESFGSETEVHEILCEKLNVCGLGQSRSCPEITAIFHDVKLLASLHEVGLRRLWAYLPLNLLQFAFSKYNELEVDKYKKKVDWEALVVKGHPQLPPFLLREPSLCSNKWSHKLQHSDGIVGPIFPLPILLVLHEFYNGCGELEERRFSVEEELSVSYDEVIRVAGDIAVPASGSDLLRDHTVSLADDEEETWVDFSNQKSFFLRSPSAFKCSSADNTQANSVYGDKIYGTFISQVPKKKPVSNEHNDLLGQEIVDDLSPIDLGFNVPLKFGAKGMKAYSILKKQLIKWHEGFDSLKMFYDQPRSSKNSAWCVEDGRLSVHKSGMSITRVRK